MILEVKILIIIIIECIIGFILFGKIRLDNNGVSLDNNDKVSVIIPARDEESNIPFILDSLKKQTYKPYEIIVVDDFSTDRTREIAGQYDVTVIQNTTLPEYWTGKSWAIRNGYLKSSGNILVFLDADVRLEPKGLETLLKNRQRIDGVISVVPFHVAEKFYERFSMLMNILGVFAFTSLFERKNSNKALYGSCIVAKREDYDKINGHICVKDEILDDINLGKRFSAAGIKIENFIGRNSVSFRMYPDGLRSEMQGFGKGAFLSTATLKTVTTIFISVWLVGLLATEFVTPVLLLFKHQLGLTFLIGYIIYTAQIIYMIQYTGRYGVIMPLLHFISSLFFIFIIAYSTFLVAILGRVPWKGRIINVGGRKKS
ncbi:MAG: glycosyltransferase family 2 protein [Clostridia bacterium]|jgi:glycosyltransferase involved in cell wall biosynthesis